MSQYYDEVLADDPLSLWKLDETSGSIAVDTMGAHDGMYVFNTDLAAVLPELGQSPLISDGSAVRFRLDDVAQNGIDFGDIYRFEGNVPFTFECWLQTLAGPTGRPGSGEGFWQRSNGGAGYEFSWVGSNLDFARNGGAQTNHVWSGGGTPLDDDTTYHVVVTYDGATLVLYVNAIARDSFASAGAAVYGADDLTFGSVLFGSNFDGMIGQALAVYGHPLSPERILAHYNAGIAPAGLSLRDVPATTIFRPKR